MSENEIEEWEQPMNALSGSGQNYSVVKNKEVIYTEGDGDQIEERLQEIREGIDVTDREQTTVSDDTIDQLKSLGYA
jgi:hypothetical protein